MRIESETKNPIFSSVAGDMERNIIITFECGSLKIFSITAREVQGNRCNVSANESLYSDSPRNGQSK